MTRTVSIALQLAGLTLATGAWAADDAALTFGQAEQIAVEHSQQLAAGDLGIAASRERAPVAGTLPDPMLKFGIDNLPVDGATRFSTQRDFMTMRRLGLSQEWVRPSTRRLHDARGTDAVKVSEAERAVILAARFGLSGATQLTS